MAFYLLHNVSGYYGDPSSDVGLTLGTSTGYSVNDFVSGPRSTWHRTNYSTSEIGRGYETAISITPTYVVVARADKLLTAAGSRVRFRQRTSGDVWSNITGPDFNPLTASHLVGPRSQDLVSAVSPTQTYGIGLAVAPASGTQATLISKFYGCEAFDFGVPPQLSASWTDLPPNQYITPLNSTMPYEIERRFSITFPMVSRSVAQAFHQTYREFSVSPFFLYDTTGDIWDHQLEHVLIENWIEDIVENDRHTFSISFARLKHYD